MSADLAEEPFARVFRRFGEACAQSSPIYAELARVVAGDATLLAIAAGEGGGEGGVKHPAVFFAAVQHVLADHPDDALAGYYPSIGGERVPDAELPGVFAAFVAAHRSGIGALLAGGRAQANEPARAAVLRPAFGWVQACLGRPLALIEVGASAGLLLYPERYGYDYGFAGGEVLEAGGGQGPLLRCRVRGAATVASLRPFVGVPLRVASRVGLDLNPLNATDAGARAWLRALVWPEHEERRVRLEAALAMAAHSPVRLRKGDALRILGDAVGAVSQPAVPCVFVSDTVGQFPVADRVRFAGLVRELGAAGDLVLIVEESAAGPGLFADFAPGVSGGASGVSGGGVGVGDGVEDMETLAAVVFQSGRERVFRLGTAGAHATWLDWAPARLS